MTITDETVVRREPLEGKVEAYSAARLERIELADGRRLVLKHLPPDGDWLTRLSGGTDRARRLWESGLLERIGRVVDHTVVDMVGHDGHDGHDGHGGHDVVVMRDVTGELLPARVPVPRATSRRLLADLAALHAAGRSEPVQPLCPIGARYTMLAPTVHAADRGPGAHPGRERILAGWEIFAERTERADPDVAAAVAAVHRDPEILGRRLGRHDTTVLHGDAKLENLGLGPSRLVAVDWGDLTGFGPAEVDVAWYALMNTGRIGGTPADVFADYETVARRRLDPEALDLACIGSLAQMGSTFARIAVQAHRAETRATSAALLDWWTARVRAALARVGL